jgi:hypothetical protein
MKLSARVELKEVCHLKLKISKRNNLQDKSLKKNQTMTPRMFNQKNNKIKVLLHRNILHLIPPHLIPLHLTLQALPHPHLLQIQFKIKKRKNKTYLQKV